MKAVTRHQLGDTTHATIDEGNGVKSQTAESAHN